MIIAVALFLATCFLAYSNGANDNFKGVASLYGCGAASYRTAITWATVTTFAGSIASIFLAQALLKKFSGKGLVPDALVGSSEFLLAVAVGAAMTVILATILGFPISTTHALTGAILGSGVVGVGAIVNLGALGNGFVLPLLLSPVVAIGVGALLYAIFRAFRVALGIRKEWCVCLGAEERVVAMPQPASILAMRSPAARVSTTHVSVGALFGIGVVTDQANPRVMLNIVLSWIVTLPCAALLAGSVYLLLRWF